MEKYSVQEKTRRQRGIVNSISILRKVRDVFFSRTRRKDPLIPPCRLNLIFYSVQRKKQNGFTLIEMMLVITVIAIIAALTLTTYRRHTETARIDKVSLEMQQVLEAALAYNVDKNKWPDARKEPDCETTPPNTQDLFVKYYVPNQNIQSNFGSYFCWSEEGSEDNKNARLFWVAFKVPKNQSALGKRIAARLPNAILTSDLTETQTVPCNSNDCYVRAEVVQPSAAGNNNNQGGGMVVATGNCPSHNNDTNLNADSSTCRQLSAQHGSKYQITFDACPEKTLPRVTAFPNSISFPKDGWPGFTVKNIDAERTNDPCTLTVDENGHRKQHCDVSVHVTFCTGKGPYKCSYTDVAQAHHPGSAGASYVVACVASKK